MMGQEFILIAVGALVFLALLALIIFKKRPRKLKQEHFSKKWKELQKLCGDKEQWPQVLSRADKLLGQALKKRRYRGKSIGERLVSAQRTMSDNDNVWFGHKLAKKVQEDPELKLKEADMKDALVGIRQALKDLGALKDDKSKAKK